MGNIGDKPIIGIMGGIGSGKSTVAAEFAKLGCKIIDADLIAHELLNKNAVKEKIVAIFGRNVVSPSGNIDRKRLGEIVFADNDKLTILNEIIHPLVIERAEELIEQYKQQNQIKAVVLDMPLLVEIGWAGRCNKLIFIDCTEKIRAERAKKKDFDENQLKFRENFQISLDNKAALADNTIENNSDFSAMVRQVADIFSDIMNNR